MTQRRVRMLWASAQASHRAGDVLRIGEPEAEALVANGQAEFVEPGSDPVETAAAAAPETAARTRRPAPSRRTNGAQRKGRQK